MPPGVAIMDNNGEMSPAALLAQMVGVIISVLYSLLAYTSDAQLEQLMYAFQSELSRRRVGHVGAASSPGATTVSPVVGHYPSCSNPSPGYSGATSSESAGPGHESDVHVVGQTRMCRNCGNRQCTKKKRPHHISRCYCDVCHQRHYQR